MKKRFIIILITVLVLNFGVALAEVGQTTINYLLGQTQDQWITMGLAATGQSSLNLGYLSGFEANSANDYSKTILALVSAGQNPYAYNGIDFVSGLESYSQNNQIGSSSLVSDDFWGILALRSAGKESNYSIIQSSKDFILNNQNSDGGWGYAPGSGSDTNDTAAAIMALLDSGLTSASPEIQEAAAYLTAAQNSDGGFPFAPGSESDSGSDAWVIAALNKLGISPTTLSQGSNNPLTHLQLLVLEDGSYRWLIGDLEGNPLMTAYVAVALSGKYYPVDYYEAPVINPTAHHLRIEGASTTYCDADVEAVNALEIVEHGAAICGYTYVIEQTSFGPYLTAINNEAAEGTNGWLYRVNWLSPALGANNYPLEDNDEVLWYFGEWGILPIRISLSDNQIEPGGQTVATVEYYNETSWSPLSAATIYAGAITAQTNDAGQATLTMPSAGSFEVYAEKDNYIRSPKLSLLVSGEVLQTINMTVNINNAGTPQGSLSFVVETTDLNFGTANLGENISLPVSITNNGNSALYLEAIVGGDLFFKDYTYLNNVLWENYSDTFAAAETKSVNVALNVPASYGGGGLKQGSLTFWAASQ